MAMAEKMQVDKRQKPSESSDTIHYHCGCEYTFWVDASTRTRNITANLCTTHYTREERWAERFIQRYETEGVLVE